MPRAKNARSLKRSRERSFADIPKERPDGKRLGNTSKVKMNEPEDINIDHHPQTVRYSKT